ncbi:MAG: ATP-binding protein, partial [Clostridiales bacterium]|nr:ATP-binding protein [Clostridiales bacterium]
MFELSLNVMDIAQNSVRAQAKLVTIRIGLDEARDFMRIEIEDDGTGMSEETRGAALDPFYTTRTTRKVGLGLPYFEMAAKMC